MRGNMQIKDGNNNSWSSTASTRLLKYLNTDVAYGKALVYQLNFKQAFIQSEAKKKMFIIHNKEYGLIYPKLANIFGDL